MRYFLFFSFLFLSACGETLTINSTPSERPRITIPDISPTVQRPIEWNVVTRENLNTRLREMDQNTVLFVLDNQNYQDLNINIADLRRFIMQQQAVIQALRQYYETPQQQ